MKLLRKINLSVVIFLSLVTISGYAADTVKLFSLVDGVPTYGADYSERVVNLRRGQKLEMSDGKIFKIKRYLGSGEYTVVYELSDGRVLRLPIDVEAETHQQHREFIVGMQALKKNGSRFPVVKIFEAHSWEYVVVEKINIYMTFEGFVALYKRKGNLNPQVQKMVTALMEFASLTAMYSNISDLHAANLVYTVDRGWMIMDVERSHRPATMVADYTIFDRKPYQAADFLPMPQELRAQLNAQVITARIFLARDRSHSERLGACKADLGG